MKQKIGKICMVVGALLILGALALMAYNQWDSNRADKASQEALDKLETALTETITENGDDAGENQPAEEPELDPTRPMTTAEIDGWEYIGYLSIPDAGLNLPVMAEWSYDGLKIAPGRYSGSTYSDDLVICGHNYAKHFSPIKWLDVGAPIYFTDMDGLRWSYEVASVEVVQPTQVERMITPETEDAWDLTLFTCTTGGRARCAVRCVRTGYPTAVETAE